MALDEEFLNGIPADEAGEGAFDDETLFKEYRCVADKGQSPLRVDKFLVEHIAHMSRNKIQQAADAGSLSVNGRPVKSNYKVKPCDVVTVTMDTPAYDNTIIPED
ncbi:MAG: RNA pseudouridine synthase, partial [Bacteroidaceae bacterium]|nr:RNA pseudouridine synthase [Bacteroidaceae bacterium]